MYAHPDAGRNDNIHGDEHTHSEAIDMYDVIFAIEKGASTTDGVSHHEWIGKICECDEMTKIMQLIMKNRHNPAFAEIMNEVETAIEGWL